MEIKKAGDRVNILTFLGEITLSDYSVGTDMSIQHPEDSKDQLIVDQKKYYNFDIDSVDKQFTYVEDEDSTLIENAAKVLEKTVDTFVLAKVDFVKAGHRVGMDINYVIGDSGTFVTVTTAATYGILTLTGGADASYDDETGKFPVSSTILGKGIKITSTGTDSKWYRIAARVSSTVIWVTNWDDTISPDQKVLDGIADYQAATGQGFKIEAVACTTATKSNIYELICKLETILNNDEVPTEDRHLSLPPWAIELLRRASELQPAIAMAYDNVVINGKVGRVSGFDIHEAPGTRVARTGGGSYSATSPVLAALNAANGYKCLANHKGFITFANKWSESRVMQATLQFANLYQGLNLYGAKVARERRKCGAALFISQA